MSQQRGYEVTVTGQYYSGSGREKVLKTYKSETFYIPETVEVVNGRNIVYKNVNGKKTKTTTPRKHKANGLKAAQHVIQRRFLAARLSEKYPDFAGVRTCQIVNQKPCVIPANALPDLEKPVKEMNLYELNVLVATESLVTKPTMFADLDDARAAIMAERRENGLSKEKPPVEEVVAEDGIGTSSDDLWPENRKDDGVPVDEEDPADALL